MTKRTVYHVSKRKNGDWAVKKEGGEKASALESTQKKAIDQAREFLANDPKGQIKIHSESGPIRTEHTYGEDPTKTPG